MKNIEENTLYLEGKKRLKTYGEYVISNRSVPDYRDGLKIVHRRILWALKSLNSDPSGGYIKSARVTGYTVGVLHPHGTTAVYDALVTLVNQSIPYIAKQGNFGSWSASPAADRYTEVKLHKQSRQLLDPNYLNAISSSNMIPNYDGKDLEPLILPSLVPNLLLNGSQGIAYGVTSNFPPLHPESVMYLLNKELQGKKVSSDILAKKLKFNWPNGSSCVSEQEQIVLWLESGKAPLYFQPEYEIDRPLKTITLNEVPPNFNWESTANKIENMSFVSSIENLTDKKTKKSATIVVKLKSSVDAEDLTKNFKKILSTFSNSFSTATNITNRLSEDNIEFSRQTISSFIKLWVDYRINLEVCMQKYLITKYDTQIYQQNLLLLAIANLDAVIKIIKTHENPKQALMAKLEIPAEDADKILDLQLRRLTKLSKDHIEKTKLELKKDKKIAIDHRDNPNPKVSSDLNNALSLLSK